MVKINNQEKRSESDIKEKREDKILAHFSVYFPAWIFWVIYFIRWSVFFYTDFIILNVLLILPLSFIAAIPFFAALYQLFRKNIKRCVYLILPVIFVFSVKFTPLGDFMVHSRFYVEYLIQRGGNPEIYRANESTRYTEWRIKTTITQYYVLVFDPSDEIIKKDRTYGSKHLYHRVYKVGGHFYMWVQYLPG